MSDQRIFSSTRWQPKGAHVGSFWTVTSISVEAAFGEEGGQVHLTGPGPCREHRSVAIDEFLQDWECVDTCDSCGSNDVVQVQIASIPDARTPYFPRRARFVRCEKHMRGG